MKILTLINIISKKIALWFETTLVRIIPRLDVKGSNVVKGIHLEGLRVVGKPAILARKYYEQGADEILYMDIVASLYERNNLLDVVKQTTSLGVYIPITIGGGIRTLEDIRQALRAGADKVAINTAATRNPNFITKAAQMFGSQCIVGSIEVKKVGDQKWEAYIDNGRQKTGLDAIEWAKKLIQLGAGELLITSIDAEGVQKGYDIELLKQIAPHLPIPVIVSGGAGNLEDVEKCINEVQCDAISMASIFHYNKTTVTDLKEYLKKKGIPLRIPSKITNNHSIQLQNRKKVSIIDYGLGNLKSVVSGFEYVGNDVKLIFSPDEILDAELLVLPGVGAFEDGMNGLKQRNLIDALIKYATSGKPLLGICLGMQLLMSESEEFGIHKGLNLIPGRVIRFSDPHTSKEKNYHVPQIGWNGIFPFNSNGWDNSILSGLPSNTLVYFVHSYYVVPNNPQHILAETQYGGQDFCSVLKKGNIYGCQFHPEKSGEVGLKILDSFGKM